MDQVLQDYLAWGWKIFPCHSIVDGRCSCSKGSECKSPGKHPRTVNGVKEASSDPAVISRWANTWPGANWALACGLASNVVVIDLDPAHGGFDSFDEYESLRRSGPLPETLKVLTGGGGRHLFFSYPTMAGTIPNRVDWLPGVDVRSNGGYVILPPGNHISGGSYSWVNKQTTMVPLPQDVAEDIASSKSSIPGAAQGLNLRDTKSILDGIPEGKRDQTLFLAACSLRRKHETDTDGGRALVTMVIMEAAKKSGFPLDEAQKCIDSAFKQDHRDEMAEGEFEPLTELGNRDRFLRIHGDNVLYMAGIGWHKWSGRGWTPLPAGEMGYMIEDVAADLRDEIGLMMDKESIKLYKEWIRKSESAACIKATETLLRGHPSVSRTVEDFDSNLTEIACLNGIVDLTTGALREFSRQDLVTKNTGVNYNPQARSRLWEDFLETSVQGDKALLEYLQQAAGYTATGLNTEECFFVISGPTGSGKSTYMDGIQRALGTYATVSRADTFMRRWGKDVAMNEIARLAGARMTCVNEIKEGDYFNDEGIKGITGGDIVTGRHLYKDTFEFLPQFKLWIATNHDPMSTDSALLRRIKRIIFSHSIPKEERDPALKTAIRTTEQEAVLAWIVEGAKRFFLAGELAEPEVISKAVQAYKADQDVLGMFLTSSIVYKEDAATSFMDMFISWKTWCDSMGQPAGKFPSFRKSMADRGYMTAWNERGEEKYHGIYVSLPQSANMPWA